MKREQITIKDLARRMNISAATVSRALRNLPEVNAQTRRAVRELAHELDYQPNYMAQSLVRSKSNFIGIVIPNIHTVFFSLAVIGIQEVLSRAGYYTMICQSGERYETEMANVRNLVSSKMDGLIICLSGETKDFSHFRALQKKGIPLVFFDRVCEDLDVCKVVVNDYEGSFNATQHLIQTGRRRIAHLSGNKMLSIGKNRLEGYIDALKACNMEVDTELIIPCGFNKEHIAAATMRLMNMHNRPDAILVINDPVAIQVMLILKEQRIRIPEDVAIVGFGNEPVSTIIDPGLTSVDQNPMELGRIAAQLLLQRLENKELITKPETKVLKTQLIVRGSSMAPKTHA
jgi:LacI family transcriptional regulator/LacI family repressor for deo operon, udp, cdd, tsx, nupC, and nupG